MAEYANHRFNVYIPDKDTEKQLLRKTQFLRISSNQTL